MGDNQSKSWFPKVGVGQGRRPYPTLFNVGSLSMALWDNVGKSVAYADDGCTVICGRNLAELNVNIRKVCDEKLEWYNSADFVINGSKSELLSFGCDPDPIIVGGCEVKPKSKIKFLGLNISSDLMWKDHVQSICQKMRLAANRIKNEGRFFNTSDKTRLFNGWVKSLLSLTPRLTYHLSLEVY